ncbi:YcxB family protein [Aliinostoc sp. HNIBRCY26]|uniref:YcxB family protein n=1 Tax=Aliinostoc sp. HNIBRCY26 TaxID=3418997 RepID=UPI003D0854BF
MNFEYRLNFNDFKEVNQFHSTRMILRYLLIVGGIAVLISLLGLINQGNVSLQEILWSVLLPNILPIVFLYCLTYFFQQIVIKRAWDSQPNFRLEIRVEASDEELKITTPLSESKAQWSLYTHWGESANLFMVYQSGNCLNMFPKRAFSTNEQVNEFRELLRSKLPKK